MKMVELDIRGAVQKISPGNFIISVAEIKSGTGRNEAIEQIAKRLLLTSLATSELLKVEENSDIAPNITLVGEIFTSRDWFSPTDSEIANIIKTLQMKPSTGSSKLHITVQKL